MPCDSPLNFDNDPIGERIYDHGESIRKLMRGEMEEKLSPIQKELNFITRLLCSVLRKLNDVEIKEYIGEEGIEWWKNHHQWDIEKRKKE